MGTGLRCLYTEADRQYGHVAFSPHGNEKGQVLDGRLPGVAKYSVLSRQLALRAVIGDSASKHDEVSHNAI
jgi:hypothetical protein